MSYYGPITRRRGRAEARWASRFLWRRRRPGPRGREYRALDRNYREFCNRKAECLCARLRADCARLRARYAALPSTRSLEDAEHTQ